MINYTGEAKMKLKPCPFCGGEAHQYGGGVSQDVPVVICDTCHAKLNGNFEKWNARADDDLVTKQTSLPKDNFDDSDLLTIAYMHGAADKNDLILAIKRKDKLLRDSEIAFEHLRFRGTARLDDKQLAQNMERRIKKELNHD